MIVRSLIPRPFIPHLCALKNLELTGEKSMNVLSNISDKLHTAATHESDLCEGEELQCSKLNHSILREDCLSFKIHNTSNYLQIEYTQDYQVWKNFKIITVNFN